jgi:adenine-specific DNA-methyltransferase
MLDMLGYIGDNIRTKTIFEPSFGSGAFLIQILDRIFEYSDANHLTSEEIISILNNVHGVELDAEWYNKTVALLTNVCRDRGIEYDWTDNMLCDDTTKLEVMQEYDLIVGNPPYIKTWDLSELEREVLTANFEFCHGNTDMYVVFFELGIEALKQGGKMCYITPNSFLRNSSQKDMRKWLAENEVVEQIIDYGTVPVFGKIATYTAITLLDMAGGHKETKYTMMKNMTEDAWSNTINLSQFGEKPWSIPSSSDEKFLKEIAERKTKLVDLCDIQYGLATNADKVYLVNKDNVKNFEPSILHPVIKGSTLASDAFIIFPYTFNEETRRYELIGEERLRDESSKTYAHLLANREKLEARNLEKDAVWYQYGRSQGIQNSRKCKFVIKHIVADGDNTCNVVRVDENTLVYSGMFVTMKDEKDAERVRKALISEEFCRYVKLVGKNMSGGYKSFNTKVVKEFGIRT